MAAFALIHGASSDSWYWHLVVPELRERGHDEVAVDLPSDDDSAGLADYTDTVVGAVREALGTRDDLVVVAQSLGGVTAPLVCARVPVRLMVLVAAMVPAPGERVGDWCANTGWEEARRRQAELDGRSVDGPFDVMTEFFHDVPPDVVAEALARGERAQSDTPMGEPWPLPAWPDVPTRFLLCRHDRFFPADFQRRVVPDRLRITPDEMDGGHLPALARPVELADWLDAYAASASGSA